METTETASSWTDAIKKAQRLTNFLHVPREIAQLESRNVIRLCTAGYSTHFFEFFKLAIELGITYLEELTIHFQVNEDHPSPLQPGGDHFGFLQFVGEKFPQKLAQAQVHQPVAKEVSFEFDSIMKLILKKLKKCEKLRILALYSPPPVEQELIDNLPSKLQALIIHSSNLRITSIPNIQLVSLRNCGISNGDFILSSLKTNEVHKKLLIKKQLQIQFGPCHRHCCAGEVSEHFSEAERCVYKLQIVDPGLVFLDLSHNKLTKKFLESVCFLVKDDPFIQVLDLSSNPFEPAIARVEVQGGLEDSSVQFAEAALSPQYYVPPSVGTIRRLIDGVRNRVVQKEMEDLKAHPAVTMLEANRVLTVFRLSTQLKALQKFIQVKLKSNLQTIVAAAAQKRECLVKDETFVTVLASNLANYARAFKKFVLDDAQVETKKIIEQPLVKMTERGRKIIEEKQKTKAAAIFTLPKPTKKKPATKKTTKKPKTLGERDIELKDFSHAEPKSLAEIAAEQQKQAIASRETSQVSGEDGDILSENGNEQEQAAEVQQKPDLDELLNVIADETFEILCQLHQNDRRAARDAFLKNQLKINGHCRRLVADVESGAMQINGIWDALYAFLQGM